MLDAPANTLTTRRSVLKALPLAASILPVSFAPDASAESIPPRDVAAHGPAGESTQDQRLRWVALAESLKREPNERTESPLAVVTPVADSAQYLRWRMEQTNEDYSQHALRKGDQFIVDFGGHRAGHFEFRLVGEGKSIDSPTRLKITFGEVPGDVAEPLYPYKGQLSSAWLPEEIITIDFLPQVVRMPRRYAFRYVKVEVLDTSPNYAARFFDIKAIALSATTGEPAELPAGTADWIRKVDRIGSRTLRDCMQTTFEDGPRRDQRLWLGDLRLQARASYVTYQNFALVKRCLFLFAGLARGSDGMLTACVFEKPAPLTTDTFILDYAALFAAVLLDYTRASKDIATARELFPVALRQFELLFKYVDAENLFHAPPDLWLFIDWNRQVDYAAAGQGVMIYAAEQLLALAALVGRENDVAAYPKLLAQMKAAGRKQYFDEQQRVCVSGPQKQISWASQAWMVLGGCITGKDAQDAMRHGVIDSTTSIAPATPYLYHHVAEAMVACDLKQEALALIKSYWGGMADAGADTFWELYDPKDSTYSPYGDVHINSFCHAWSCTPVWFFRSLHLS